MLGATAYITPDCRRATPDFSRVKLVDEKSTDRLTERISVDYWSTMSRRSLLIEADTYERIARRATLDGVSVDDVSEFLIRRALGDSVDEIQRELAEAEPDPECPRCGGCLIERDHAMSGCPGGDPGE